MNLLAAITNVLAKDSCYMTLGYIEFLGNVIMGIVSGVIHFSHVGYLFVGKLRSTTILAKEFIYCASTFSRSILIVFFDSSNKKMKRIYT